MNIALRKNNATTTPGAASRHSSLACAGCRGIPFWDRGHGDLPYNDLSEVAMLICPCLLGVKTMMVRPAAPDTADMLGSTAHGDAALACG
jgi:hypothetical protein